MLLREPDVTRQAKRNYRFGPEFIPLWHFSLSIPVYIRCSAREAPSIRYHERATACFCVHGFDGWTLRPKVSQRARAILH